MLAVSAVFVFSACTSQDTPATETETETVTEADIKQTAAPEENKEYKELFAKYKECEEQYFKNTETAVNTLIGQRYAYAITAYEHSRELTEIAEMFFDDISENTLNIYFALRGFEDKEYSADENKAEYKCRKNDDIHVYTVEYEITTETINVTHTVNGEKKDYLACVISDDGLYKECYSGSLQRTFVSRVNKDGTSKIEWYDRDVTEDKPTEEEEHGYVIYDGLTLSGVIK